MHGAYLSFLMLIPVIMGYEELSSGRDDLSKLYKLLGDGPTGVTK